MPQKDKETGSVRKLFPTFRLRSSEKMLEILYGLFNGDANAIYTVLEKS